MFSIENVQYTESSLYTESSIAGSRQLFLKSFLYYCVLCKEHTRAFTFENLVSVLFNHFFAAPIRQVTRFRGVNVLSAKLQEQRLQLAMAIKSLIVLYLKVQ